MTVAGNLIDNKLLKLSGETIPLSAISSISTGYENPWQRLGFFLVLSGIITIVLISSVAAAATGWGIIALVIGICLICAKQHFLLLNLHSGRVIRRNMRKRQVFQAQREIENALLGLPEALSLSPRQTAPTAYDDR